MSALSPLVELLRDLIRKVIDLGKRVSALEKGQAELTARQTADEQKTAATVAAVQDLANSVAELADELAALNPQPAASARLVFQGATMSGQITVDTTTGRAVLQFLDDKGDTDAAAPEGAVVTFASSDEAVLTVTQDADNPLVARVDPVAEGSADVSVSILTADGSPIMEPDGVTPFSASPLTITVGPGVAVGAALTLSV